MSMTLVTLRLDPADATPDAVRRLLRLAPDDLDETFGVIGVDPTTGTFAVRLEAAAAVRCLAAGSVLGPWADPVIEPFDPRGA